MTLQGYERRLSDRDRKRIARTLRPLRDGVNLTEALDEVETVTQWYWLDYQRRRLSRKEIANELVEIAKCADQLLCAVALIKRDGWFELNSQLQSAQRQRELDRMGAWQRDLLGGELDIKRAGLAEFVAYTECLRSAARNFDPRGRPREIGLSRYAVELALIYEDATGTKPRRRYNSYRRHPGEAEHLPFFAACMNAAGVTKYPARIIRQALEAYSVLSADHPARIIRQALYKLSVVPIDYPSCVIRQALES